MLLAALGAAPVRAATCRPAIIDAGYRGPTARYPHGVLGDTEEWSILQVTTTMPPGCPGTTKVSARALPDALVFEDVAPRLADLDGDGRAEVIVVESHQRRGARLAVWGLGQDGFERIAATPFIGTRFRWLAPVGAADLDGDGKVEIAYVDRPHLDQVLRVLRFERGNLRQVASLAGLSNHRIGDREISGGIRDCGAGGEIVTASADWSTILATRLSGGRLEARVVADDTAPSAFARVLSCR